MGKAVPIPSELGRVSVQGDGVLVHSGWRAAGAELAAGAGDRGAGREGPGTEPAATGSAALPQSLERPGLVGGAGTPERAVAPTQSPLAPRGPLRSRGGREPPPPSFRPATLPCLHLLRLGLLRSLLPHLRPVCLLELVAISSSLTWNRRRVGMSRCALVQK